MPDQPIIFLKPWSSINYQPTKLSLPIAATHKIDHEVELGVFISKGGSHIKKEDAMAYVGGYFLAIDWTDRGSSNFTQIYRQSPKQKDGLGPYQKVKITFVPYLLLFHLLLIPTQFRSRFR